MSKEELSPEDRELVLELAKLRPAQPAFDLASILARRLETSRQRLVAWRFTAAALAACLVLSFLVRPRPTRIEPTIPLPRRAATAETPPVAADPPSPLSYIMLRQRIPHVLDLENTTPAHSTVRPVERMPRRPLHPHHNLRTLNQTAPEQL